MKLEIPFLSKAGNASGLAGDEGHQLFDSLHGRGYQANQRGRVFTQTTTPLGLAIPIYTATAPIGNALWNPLGSGVKCVLMTYTAAAVSGTAVYGAIVLMARNGVGSVIGTGQQITAFAETIPVNGRLSNVNSIAGNGGGYASKAKSSNAGTVTITAGVAAEAVRTLFGINGEGAAAGLHGTVNTTHEFEGRVVVYPGTLVWVACTLASVALYAQTLEWEEVDI